MGWRVFRSPSRAGTSPWCRRMRSPTTATGFARLRDSRWPTWACSAPASARSKCSAKVPLDDAKLFAPIGIDIGADGPEQVAVSIVAEMLAVNARREAGHLRARTGGIHDP